MKSCIARNFGEIASAITANFIAEKQFFSGQALPANNLSPAVRTNNKISHFNNPPFNIYRAASKSTLIYPM